MFSVKVTKVRPSWDEQEKLLTANAVNAFQCEFTFSSEWDGLTKIAVFKTESVDKIKFILDETNTCFIPWEMFVNIGDTIKVGAVGMTGHPDDPTSMVVMPTTWLTAGQVVESVYDGVFEGEDPRAPSIDIYQQMIQTRANGVRIVGSMLQLLSDGHILAEVTLPSLGGGGGSGVNADVEEQLELIRAELSKKADSDIVDNALTQIIDGFSNSLSTKQDKLHFGDSFILSGETLDVRCPVQGIFTEEQFNALPEEERNRGAYFIDDSTISSSSGSSMEVYDNEERVIGTWFGKRLYRKVFHVTTPKNVNTESRIIALEQEMPETIVRFDGFAVRERDGVHFRVNSDFLGTNTDRMSFIYRPNEFGINGYVTGADMLGMPLTLILEYTKVADSEGIV